MHGFLGIKIKKLQLSVAPLCATAPRLGITGLDSLERDRLEQGSQTQNDSRAA